LNTIKKTLVLGASLNPTRYSNIAINRLMSYAVPTVAFGLRQGAVAGVTIDTKLIAYKNIHTLTLYLNPKRQESYYDYILSLKPKRVIFNPGTENANLMALLDTNDISYEIACTLTLLAIDSF